MHYLSLIQKPQHRAPALENSTLRDIRILDEALADDSRRDIAETLLALAAKLIAERSERDEHPAPLTTSERAALSRLNVDEGPMSESDFFASRPVQEGLAYRVQMIETAIPLAEAARRIGVTDGRLRQRIAEGTLLAIPRPHGRGWLIPIFQLTEKGELPHLAQILSVRQRPASAEAIARALELPNDELGGQSPRAWLISGGDPVPVKRIIAGL